VRRLGVRAAIDECGATTPRCACRAHEGGRKALAERHTGQRLLLLEPIEGKVLQAGGDGFKAIVGDLHVGAHHGGVPCERGVAMGTVCPPKGTASAQLWSAEMSTNEHCALPVLGQVSPDPNLAPLHVDVPARGQILEDSIDHAARGAYSLGDDLLAHALDERAVSTLLR
jgi:hypothetical protein